MGPLPDCKFWDCSDEAKWTARVCVDAGSSTKYGGFQRRDEEIPYCDEHADDMRNMRFTVTPLDAA